MLFQAQIQCVLLVSAMPMWSSFVGASLALPAQNWVQGELLSCLLPKTMIHANLTQLTSQHHLMGDET